MVILLHLYETRWSVVHKLGCRRGDCIVSVRTDDEEEEEEEMVYYVQWRRQDLWRGGQSVKLCHGARHGGLQDRVQQLLEFCDIMQY